MICMLLSITTCRFSDCISVLYEKYMGIYHPKKPHSVEV